MGRRRMPSEYLSDNEKKRVLLSFANDNKASLWCAWCEKPVEMTPYQLNQRKYKRAADIHFGQRCKKPRRGRLETNLSAYARKLPRLCMPKHAWVVQCHGMVPQRLRDAALLQLPASKWKTLAPNVDSRQQQYISLATAGAELKEIAGIVLSGVAGACGGDAYLRWYCWANTALLTLLNPHSCTGTGVLALCWHCVAHIAVLTLLC